MEQQIKNGGLDPEMFEKIIEIFKNNNFINYLDIRLKSLAPGEAVMTMHIQNQHLNTYKNAHGGATFSLLDTVMGSTLRTLGYYGNTVEMNINYLLPVESNQVVTAIGKVIKAGKRIVVLEGSLFDQKGNVAVIARGTFINKGTYSPAK